MKNSDNEILHDTGEIVLLGLSHKTAPVEVRECFSINEDDVPAFLKKAGSAGIKEIVYLATCNRVEVYFTARDRHKKIELILSLLEEHSGLSKDRFSLHLYKKQGRDAVSHLFSVAASLDSMVIGENEIFGQLKDAYRRAVECGSTGAVLNRLFHHAFSSAKKIKTDTEISKNPLSIAYIAVEQAKKIFDDLSTKKALLIGAGEMGELILKYFDKSNIRDITIANRSLANAERIVDDIKRETKIVSLDRIEDETAESDIIISSVTSDRHIITYPMIKNIFRKRKGRPLFLIDIAVPRNIDPGINRVADVFLFNIDDLKLIADENLKNRLKEVGIAEEIIEQSVDEFIEWYNGLEIVPVIAAIQKNFNDVRESELEKYRRKKLKHLTEKDLAVVEELTRQIMTKTLHNPIMSLKKFQSVHREGHHDSKSIKEKTRIIKELFNNDD